MGLIPRSLFSSPLMPSERTANIQDYLPEFKIGDPLSVYCQNSAVDAERYCYLTPCLSIGQAGFFIDEGMRIGYVLSTWQGHIDPSLPFKDLSYLIALAEKRSQISLPHSFPSLGAWSKPWIIGGEVSALVTQIKNRIASGQ